MDKKEFTKLTTQVFKDYGFLKIGNQFFLNLDRVVIDVYMVGARFESGAKAFMETACFKDIHEDYKFETKEDYKNMPTDIGMYGYLRSREILYSRDKQYNKWAFYPEDYNSEEWENILSEILHKAYDPYKTDFENYVRTKYAGKASGLKLASRQAFKERGIIFE